jgi:YebC/PmpR family DNA-binding regulatory protein
MSGHSKWSTIKRKKGATDAKRGKLFTKLIREITIAARESGGDPDANPRLRLAIDKAKGSSMPKDNIARAIKKGTGELAGEGTLEECTFEGYGPGGVAVVAQVVTDNKNRTTPEIKRVFSKSGGSIGKAGCVAWQFENKGLILVEQKVTSEDQLMDVALEAGAEDIKESDKEFEILCSAEAFTTVKDELDKAKIAYHFAEVSMIPQNTVQLAGKDAEQMLRLMDELEDHDDVQNVFANFDIDESIMADAS